MKIDKSTLSKFCARAVFLAFFVLAGFVSCSSEAGHSIQREDLASFDIGVLEDELDIFNIEGRAGHKKTELAMRDGQFYVSNGPGAKIVRYNSYGDLLFMIYNDETNPRLLSLKQKTDGAAETRWAWAWPLREPSFIAVDSRKHIYVVDKLPPERHSIDAKDKAILDSVTLHFDDTGRFVDYIGQGGPGGAPFARVEGIWTTQNDELVVVCRFSLGIKAFYYDAEGNHISTLQFSNEKLPVPEGKQGVISSFEGISVAPDAPVIYLKINYYRKVFDAVVDTAAGVEIDGSFLWLVDMNSGDYLSSVEIPLFEAKEPDENGNRRALYSLFGAAAGGNVFFYTPVEEGYSILILGTDEEQKQRRGVIKVNPDELQFITFHVSENGVLSALLSDNFKIRLVWWRTDHLVQE